MTKVLVIGNCQARPVASILQNLCSDLDMLDPIILHLSKAEHEKSQSKLIKRADLVFAQYTDSSFQPAHLRSSALKDKWPKKTFVWPNIFYAGQQPFLRYVTHAPGGRIMGPLDAYHDLRILEDWYNAQAMALPFHKTPMEHIHQHSLGELKARENAGCDVHVSDLIEERVTKERLFFTFNHPSLALLSGVTTRLLKVSGLKPASTELEMKEPLARIIPPSTWEDDDLVDQTFRGPRLDYASPNLALPGPPIDYPYETLKALFFECYDLQKDLLLEPDKIRVTPNYR